VEGSIIPGQGKTSRLDIATPGGKSELRSRGAEGTEFSVSVNPDDSSTIAIHSGVAEIKTADGTLKVGPDEAITYDTSGFVGRAAPIPDPPALQSPTDGDDLVFGTIPPRILFSWGGRTVADAYRFVIARDRELHDVVFDRELIGTEFVHGNLQSGRYYWCVKTVTGYVESRCSTVRDFRLIQDLEPPDLRVDLPQGAVAAAKMVVRGAAEPGSELFIKNEQVTLAANGEFEYVVKLSPGLNMIIVEAIDAAGNSAYRSQYVTADF
jgi:hypothetical protein